MRIRKLAAAALAAAAIAGCQGEPGAGRLVPDDIGLPGHSVAGGAAVYDSASVKVAARQVPKGEETGKLLRALSEKDYVLVELAIENTSGKTVIFKPNHASLRGEDDFLRPLDYTDLYVMGDMEGLEEIKGSFYDLDVTLMPGDKASRLLIFKPLAKGMKRASIEINELYIGTEAVKLALPFSLRPQG